MRTIFLNKNIISGWSENPARGWTRAAQNNLHWPGGHDGGRGDDGGGDDDHPQEPLTAGSADHWVQEAHQSTAQTEETHLRLHWPACWVSFTMFLLNQNLNLLFQSSHWSLWSHCWKINHEVHSFWSSSQRSVQHDSPVCLPRHTWTTKVEKQILGAHAFK